MSRNQVVVVVIVAACLVFVALGALLLRAQMSGEAKFLGLRLKLSAKRQAEPQSGSAVIEDSKSTHGGASAIAPQRARISRTEVHGDIVSRVEGSDDPKE